MAEEIRSQIHLKLNRNVCVVVADTDKTYRFRNFYFTPKPNPMKGINSFGGVVTYVVGRVLGSRKAQLLWRSRVAVLKQARL